MPVLDTPQKAFYDTRRQFQGKDDPARTAPALAPPATKIPIGQFIAGAIFLAVIALAFFAFAIPQKPIGLTNTKALATAPTK